MSVYNRFYGFKENTFHQTPDSSFFFASLKHQTALDALVYAVKQRKGFVVLTGEVGSGKTTLGRKLLRHLGPDMKTAIINHTSLTPKGVLTLILEDLDIDYRDGSKTSLLLQLNEYLISQARQDKNVILMIDEAQNLSFECLEEVRMLSNLETEKEKLIQIILMGQPELRKKLDSPKLEQLRQRVAISYHLQPLGLDESRDYVFHRLTLAKDKASERDVKTLFDAASFEIIYQYSQGLPRLINRLCDHALLTGFVQNSEVIKSSMVTEAAEELHSKQEKKHEQIYQSA